MTAAERGSREEQCPVCGAMSLATNAIDPAHSEWLCCACGAGGTIRHDLKKRDVAADDGDVIQVEFVFGGGR